MIFKSHVSKNSLFICQFSEKHLYRLFTGFPLFIVHFTYEMSYYGNSNNNWNSRPGAGIEEVDLSSGAYPPPQSDPFAGPGPRVPGSGPPPFGQPGQSPGQGPWQRPAGVSDQIRDASTKQYNDFLEKQGIPSISPEDMEVRIMFYFVNYCLLTILF